MRYVVVMQHIDYYISENYEQKPENSIVACRPGKVSRIVHHFLTIFLRKLLVRKYHPR